MSANGTNRHNVAGGQASEAIDIVQDGSVIMVEVLSPSGSQRTYTIVVKREKDATTPPLTDTPLDRIEFVQNAYTLQANEVSSKNKVLD